MFEVNLSKYVISPEFCEILELANDEFYQINVKTLLQQIQLEIYSIAGHAKLTEHKALRHKLKSCTVPFLYRSDLVKSRRMLYRPDVCNCTMPYVPRTVPAYAVRDSAYTAEVFALTLVEIDVRKYVQSSTVCTISSAALFYSVIFSKQS